MRVLVAQLNPTIGELQRNVDRLLAAVNSARAHGANLVVAPELALTGYPPRDLLDRPTFIADTLAALRSLVQRCHGPALLVGSVASAAGDPLHSDGPISNAALLIQDGAVLACHRKMLLPTYDVFDEGRYFTPGGEATVASLAGVRLGLTVCEDIWNDKQYWKTPRYARDPVAETFAAGAELLINISASPFDAQKPPERTGMLAAMARRYGRPVLYVNQVGGQDSLIFDGRSLCVGADGSATWRAPAFQEATVPVDPLAEASASDVPESSWADDALAALSMGLRDYVRKCGFERVVLGLSGGIDSALTAAIAVHALGRDQVLGLSMPSRYSSEGSRADAAALAQRLGVHMDVVPIEEVFSAFLHTLAGPFAGLPADVTEENLQARIRGALLMAYSNKLGALLLTTGNKSELAVGYSTLYGDMCGGLAVISDLYKMQVYELARHVNRVMSPPPIPEASFTKPPSAELRPDQRDEDSLPPYPVLDGILHGYIDEARGYRGLVAQGHDPATVARVIAMVDRAEYKRRQMPPGLRVSRKAFGEGRRLPIAQRYVPSYAGGT